jgi:pyruvate formate lyase activating enzyme
VEEVGKMREALFFELLDAERVKCDLCPHHCILKNGQTGICGVRKNIDGALYSLNYGQVSAVSMDPIEKKPLFHFHPGEEILSIGSWGCNMACPFCQNWEISHAIPHVRDFSPAQFVSLTRAHHSFGIAYTYSEPIVWFEYVLDCARSAMKDGLDNVLVTNGFIEEQPFKLLIQYFSAMNIDVKSFDPEYYRKVLGGQRDIVMKNVEAAHKAGVHVEITTLVVPGDNDSEEEIDVISGWLSSIDRSIPLHLSRYYPNYKYDRPATDVDLLEKLWHVAKAHLDYVYIGNVPGMHEDTICPNCGQIVIKRMGYDVKIVGLDEEGSCTNCHHPIAVRKVI